MSLGQLGPALGARRALAHPVVHAIQLQLPAALLAGRDRVEKADLFQGRTALTHPAVRDNDVIEGRFLRPATGEPDRDHACLRLKIFTKAGRPGASLPAKGANYTENRRVFKGPWPGGVFLASPD